jgi:ATP-dependent helicase HrpA
MVLLCEHKNARLLQRTLKDARNLGLQYAPLGTFDALADSLLRASVWHCFFDRAELPRTAAEFDLRLTQRRSRWKACFDLLMEHAIAIIGRRFDVVHALSLARSPAYVAAVKDMNAHVARLVPPDFVNTIALRHLGEIRRYLDAVQQRLDGLQGRVDKDAQAAAEIAAFEARLARVIAELGERDDLDDAAFLIEEYRVAVFAQRLRTKGKVSAKRIETTLAVFEEEAGVR